MSRLVVLITVFLAFAAHAFPGFDLFKKSVKSSEATLLDDKDFVLARYREHFKFRQSEWTALESFHPLLIQLLLAQEDQSFYEHKGVDWVSVLKSLTSSFLSNSKAKGASTLSMQLVNLLELKVKGRKTFNQKIKQIELAKNLEKTWTKSQILEAYLNLVPLRSEFIGVPAFSQFFWNKEVSQLTSAEILLTIALIPSPQQSWDKVKSRACRLLAQFKPALQLSCEEIQSTLQNKLSLTQSGTLKSETQSLWLVNALRANPKLKERFKIDSALQLQISQYAKEILSTLQNRHVHEIAFVVMDLKHKDLPIKAYGGVSLQNSQVDGVQANRQVGSTLKPFFYAKALQDKLFTLESVLKDEPIQIQDSRGLYKPENYRREYHGRVTFSEALASSLNSPAIQIVQKIGVDSSVTLLRQLGLNVPFQNDNYGESIALGTLDLSLFQLTEVYGRFARTAFYPSQSNLLESVLNQQSALQISKVLSHAKSRSLGFGLGSVLQTPYYSSVKTGTSKDMRDNWCMGYNSSYVVGVWVGNFDGSPMRDVSGVSGAAPLWRKVMDVLPREQEPLTLTQISLPEVLPISLFSLSQPNEVAVNKIASFKSPIEGGIYALDPDIPIDAQRIPLQLEELPKDSCQLQVFLNDKNLGPFCKVKGISLKELSKGKSTLQIKSEKGIILAHSSFFLK